MSKDQIRSERPEITLAKASGIILMIAAHCNIAAYAHDVIYLFHMPLFFLLSGLFFKMDYVDHPLHLLRRRLKRLWWPFVVSTVLFVLLHNVLCEIHIQGLLSDGPRGTAVYPYGWRDFLIHGLNALRFYNEELMTGPAWFLASLFYATFMLWGVLKLRACFKNKVLGTVAGYVLLIAAVTLLYKTGFVSHGLNCISGHNVLAALLMLLAFDGRRLVLDRWRYPAYAILLALFLLLVIGKFYRMGMFGDGSLPMWWSWPLYVLTSFLGTYIIIGISRRLVPTVLLRPLHRVGQDTLWILLLHLSAFKIVTWFVVYFKGLRPEYLESYPTLTACDHGAVTVAYILVGLVIPVVLKQLWSRLRTTMGGKIALIRKK